MFKKIAASVALAGALAFAAAGPAVVSTAIGNWPDPMRIEAIGNWPDPMRIEAIGNWPDPMKVSADTTGTYSPSSIGNWPDPM